MTLSEKSTLTSPYYLMRLTNDTTRQEKVFLLAADQSSYTYRYNQFTLTETSGTEILTSGTVNLLPTGFWTYEVWEQSSSTSLSVESATTLVETGKVKVVGTDTSYTQHGINTTYKAHGTGT
jgi:hypothetical protein